MLKRVGPEGSVIAIEPDPNKRNTLARISAPNLTVHDVAVGEADGVMPLYRPCDAQASRWHTLEMRHVRAAKPPIEVPMRRLDNIVSTADVVKIDCQGSELHILDGAPHLLQTCPTW